VRGTGGVVRAGEQTEGEEGAEGGTEGDRQRVCGGAGLDTRPRVPRQRRRRLLAQAHTGTSARGLTHA